MNDSPSPVSTAKVRELLPPRVKGEPIDARQAVALFLDEFAKRVLISQSAVLFNSLLHYEGPSP